MRWSLALLLLVGCAAGDIEDDDTVDAIVGVTPGDCPARADCAERACGIEPVCGTDCGSCGAGADCVAGQCVCVPDCEGRTCRPDGCGGICEACPAGQGCSNGACVDLGECPAAAACGERVCGPDPVCQTDCGACPDGEVCQDGQCAAAPEGCPDIADCADRACGPDPVCGVACGQCEMGECLDGACIVDICGPRVCGPDGMGGSCGTCPDGQACGDGQCACVPSCDGLVCGDDGCGGSCGECPMGVACDAGTCACDARWVTPVAGLVRGVVEVGAYVVAYGQADGGAHAWVFDLCGAPVNDAPVALPGAAAGAMLTVGHAVDDDLLVGGPISAAQGMAADIDAAVTRLTLPDLTPAWATRIDTGAAQTTISDLARDAQGEVWFAGAQGFYPNLTARLGLIDGAGAACAWPPLASDANATHEVTTSADGATVFVSVIDAPVAAIDRYSADCLLAPGCACVPDGRVELPDVAAGAFAAMSGLEVAGDVAYVAVYWFTQGFQDMRGEVRRVPLDGGEQTIFVWNPTATFDFLYDLILVPDGGVRVAAARGFAVMGQPPNDAVMLAFGPELGEPVEHVVGPGILVDLAAGRGAIYAVRTLNMESFVHRCAESGACAP